MTDRPADNRVRKSEIDRQEIGDPDRQHYGSHHDLKCIKNVPALNTVCKEKHVIVRTPAAFLQLEAAKKTDRDRVKDHRYHNHDRRKNEKIWQYLLNGRFFHILSLLLLKSSDLFIPFLI